MTDLPLLDERSHLRADCSRCAALCCVGPAFAASADFAIDKPAWTPCPNLRPDDRCGIHDRLRDRGFPGCTVFDCFGAGQRIVQETFGGRSWRETPELAGEQFAVLPVMRQLHEMLAHLRDALALDPDEQTRAGLAAAAEEVTRSASGSSDDLLAVDLVAVRSRVGGLLRTASATARGRRRVRDGIRPPPRRLRAGADLVAADLRGRDLRTADLRGALLIAADLRDADLRWADLLGADLRDADLRGARLDGALFLTRPQLAAART
jgi:hypothetical protein